jgi:hypothetical protein
VGLALIDIGPTLMGNVNPPLPIRPSAAQLMADNRNKITRKERKGCVFCD